MPEGFLDQQAKEAITDAIKDIEARCSAEVVVVVRARSAGYLHVPVMLGIVAAFAMQAVALYSDFSFSLLSILLEPFAVGLVAGLLASRAPMLGRWLTPAAVKRRHVARAAKAAFYDKGVRHTRERTGMLVYVSLVERMVEIVIDSGVEAVIARVGWDEVVGRVAETVRRGGDGSKVAEALRGLGDILAPVLVRGDDDINELPDEVCG